jgi:eukaryotic-like serine/threonine-protein kinase
VEAATAIKPERFGRYVLLDRIGEGGMAEVFRAIMPGVEGFKRTLVIKKILGRLSESAKFVDMFVREARIGALLNHPNIVQVYDFGNVDGHYFLAMEYVRGRDVLAIIRRLRDMRRPFPVAVAAYIAREVASCLAYAHALAGPDGRSLGIVHRDVSPSNVMCLREGGVKLLDFGIASALSESGVERTDQGAFKGKLAYMAPERMHNEPLDGRADLYSLGVMLWEMLTCKRLFRGTSEAETFHNVLEMPIPRPSTESAGVPPSLDAIVLRTLERNRDKRYQTGKALADDLEEVLRECNFRSKMLPSLLLELFGSGIHSSQVAMSCLTPELLAAAASAAPNSTGTGSLSLTPVISRRRAWPLWLAGAAVVAVLTLLWGVRAGWFASPRMERASVQPASPSPTAAMVVPPLPQPAPAVVAAPPVVPPTTPPTTPVAPAPVAPKAKRASGQRPAKPVARAAEDAIAKGRSIDPFAEAATRGH